MRCVWLAVLFYCLRSYFASVLESCFKIGNLYVWAMRLIILYGIFITEVCYIFFILSHSAVSFNSVVYVFVKYCELELPSGSWKALRSDIQLKNSTMPISEIK